MKEEKATGTKLLDSSIWLAYLLDGSHKEIIESNTIFFISSLSIFEIKKKLLEKKVLERDVEEKIKFIKERAISIALDNIIAEKAADIAIKHKIPSIDSLIYTTAIKNNSQLISLDNDFRNLPNAQVLD